MLRRLLAFLVFGMSVASVTAVAVAQEETDTSGPDQSTSEAAEPAKGEALPPAANPPTAKPQSAPVPMPEEKKEAKPAGVLSGWTTEFNGYFRAPLALGISKRADPMQTESTDKHLQLSYAPNRVMDWNYYSFAYTRLQEQDWAEVTFHAKRKHVDAAVGFMGYWFAAAGFRNPDAQQIPGIAYLKLDTDVEVAGIKPNIALTMGAFWPGYGYFEKYDTFTLGRFRHMGEQLKFTVPVTDEITITLEQGFGAARDGKYDYGTAVSAPKYSALVGANLVAYGNLRAEYMKYVSLGLHYNYEWTRDPDRTNDLGGDKSYTNARKAHMSVVGGELKVQFPLFGKLWVSPSFISVKNGYALTGEGGTEVLHAVSGAGVAWNFLGYTNSTADSTGTGTIFDIGFTYENALSNILPDFGLPEVKLSVFGLIARSKLDLPKTKGPFSPTQDKIMQYKYGADLTVVPLTWLAVMYRYDTVSLLDKPGYVFSAHTGRVIFFSNWLSSEKIYLQFSKYKYGDQMNLVAHYPWTTDPIVVGSNVLQNKGYVGEDPDEVVIKIQAEVTF
jgi:hypothetical protein